MIRQIARMLIMTLCLAGVAPLTTGCAQIGMNLKENVLGTPKRDQLVKDVEQAREAQEDAKEQFRTALDQFRSVVAFEGGELEAQYNKLNAEFERSEARAKEVKTRIDDIEVVANALFVEWERELEQYRDARLRASSERQLRETRSLATNLITSMRQAEAAMQPVLDAFQDQVLFLKHNLNARAIASLEGEVTALEGEIETLIQEMEKSIAEADAFIARMQSNSVPEPDGVED